MDQLRLFLPGFAVRGSLYRPGLPNSWRALEPPPLSRTHGRFQVYRDWLLGVLTHEGRPVQLAGHSMGAALAITAAADRPDLVERLILFSPAGLPLSKPMLDSLVLLTRQALQGLYPAAEVAAVVTATTRHPWATYRLAREAHDLDLREEMGRVSAAGIPTLVVGCATDTLTTPAVCEAVARRLGGECRQVEGGGHMWMLSNWPGFQGILGR
ncbi:MAG: alpha/beta fold hydrolase [Verrucomicrobiota bacterium]